MPDTGSQLSNVGSITKALLDALDQIENQVASSLVGPDGKPLGSAIYMHMPTGYPIDPKMFANPWTPAGGDSSSQFSNEGAFSAPAQAAVLDSTGRAAWLRLSAAGQARPADGSVHPGGVLYVEARRPDAESDEERRRTCLAGPKRQRRIIHGGQGHAADGQSPPAQAVLDKVAAAQNLLYLKDANGNLIGYTPLYAKFRRNQQPGRRDCRAGERLRPGDGRSRRRAGVADRGEQLCKQSHRGTERLQRHGPPNRCRMPSTRSRRKAKGRSRRLPQWRTKCMTPIRSSSRAAFPPACPGLTSARRHGGTTRTNPSASRRSPEPARHMTRGPVPGQARSQAIGNGSSHSRTAAAAGSTSAFTAPPSAAATPMRPTPSPTMRTNSIGPATRTIRARLQ